MDLFVSLSLSLSFSLSLSLSLSLSSESLTLIIILLTLYFSLPSLFLPGLGQLSPFVRFFLNHDNVDGNGVFGARMRRMYHMMNVSGSMDADCLSAFPPDQQWQCLFPAVTYPFISTPIFVSNSLYDSFQQECIFTSMPVALTSSEPVRTPTLPYPSSSSSSFSLSLSISLTRSLSISRPFFDKFFQYLIFPMQYNCSAVTGWSRIMRPYFPSLNTVTQIRHLTQYALDMVFALTSSPTWHRSGNGGFLYSCFTHCAEENAEEWESIAVAGVTMQHAFSKFYFGAEMRLVDCFLSDTVDCNPSCPSAGRNASTVTP